MKKIIVNPAVTDDGRACNENRMFSLQAQGADLSEKFSVTNAQALRRSALSFGNVDVASNLVKVLH